MLETNVDITLVRCDGESYTCTPIQGVSWFEKVKMSVQDNGLVAARVVTVRIPEAQLPAGTMPKVGDYLVKGQVETVTGRADLDAHPYAVVIGVGDNRRGTGLRHVVVTCG